MSHKNDHILLNLEFLGRQRIMLSDIGMSWPPPERLYMDLGVNALREARDGDEGKFIFKRISISRLTDEQMKNLPMIARAAEYVYEHSIQ